MNEASRDNDKTLFMIQDVDIGEDTSVLFVLKGVLGHKERKIGLSCNCPVDRSILVFILV